MIKAAIICNSAEHVRVLLGLDPNDPKYLVITPERTAKMHGFKDIKYYELRAMLARELAYAQSHGWEKVDNL